MGGKDGTEHSSDWDMSGTFGDIWGHLVQQLQLQGHRCTRMWTPTWCVSYLRLHRYEAVLAEAGEGGSLYRAAVEEVVVVFQVTDLREWQHTNQTTSVLYTNIYKIYETFISGACTGIRVEHTHKHRPNVGLRPGSLTLIIQQLGTGKNDTRRNITLHTHTHTHTHFCKPTQARKRFETWS